MTLHHIHDIDSRHKALSRDSSGSWSCHDCYKDASRSTDPEEVECDFHGIHALIRHLSTRKFETLYVGPLDDCIMWLQDHVDDIGKQMLRIEPAFIDLSPERD